MKTNQQKMLGTLVREGRMAKGYTQQELADLTKISTRSIQRIENGEIMPRSFTVKTLAKALGLSEGEIARITTGEKKNVGINRTQKIILSVGITLLSLLLAFAYMAQAGNFPETTFELLIFLAAVMLIITTALVLLWK